MPKSAFAVLSSLFAISDEQAMWRVQAHDDAAAFAQLMRRWERPIRNLCTRMISDGHRAEDLTQDVFARVYARRKDYQPKGKFSTWLWRIALNLCHDELRRIRRCGVHSLDDLPGEDDRDRSIWAVAPMPAPDGMLDESERAGIVRGAVMQLPEHYRSVVVLRHYEDLKFREIAEVLGIPEGTVKSRMAEAMTQLGRALEHVLRDRPELECDKVK